MDLPTFAQLTATVHSYILVRALWGIVCQPVVQPINWWRLCGKSSTEKASTVMVGEKHITGFAIDADEVAVSVGITTFLYHETEING
jgi:hypothetical protein